jgi:DNA-binding NarL/FixJ family response regulator
VSELTQVLGELQQVHRELVEQRYVRRADGIERVREALRGLGELGSPAGIIGRSAERLGAASELDVVLVSRLEDDHIRPLALWLRDDPPAAARALAELERRAVRLGYPLIEAEVVQRHQPVLVTVAESGRRAAPDLADVLGWQTYGVADITIEGKAAGLLHAAREGAIVDELDLELVSLYAGGLAQAFERAVLREHLERQRSQLQSAAQWIGGQMLQLSTAPTTNSADSGGAVTDLLTARELDVLRLVAQGLSDAEIAERLVLSQHTVHRHVANVRTKLRLPSRSAAVAYAARAGLL